MRLKQLLARSTLVALAVLNLSPVATAADAPPAAGSAARPPIADFFSNPEFSGALLSPSGKYLAVRLGKKDQRDALAVITLSDNSIKGVGNFSDADIGSFDWVNDERLVFTATDRTVGFGDARYAPGLYAVNRDGSKFVQLASRAGKPFITAGGATAIRSRELLPWNTYLLGQPNRQDSEFVYVVKPAIQPTRQIDYVELQRLNTLTGRYTSGKRPGDSMSWLLDLNGEPRLTTTVEHGISTIYHRDPAKDPEWHKLVSFNTFTGGKGAFTPLTFGPDGTLYVVSNSGQDKSAVYTFNWTTNKVSEQPLVVLDGYDFRGKLIFGKNKVLGVRRVTDALDTTWLDDGMKAMQAKVDEMLPYTINLLTLPTKPESPWVLVESYSDRSPPRILLYNSDTQKLNLVGGSHPHIDPNQMGQESLVHYKARDGLDIPAWLTLPKGGGKNLPLVVLVHGGPYLRGSIWGWDPEVQFLASRGYAVLQP
jgi:dipeptidyl aminopeptidase/acylaminoacyl peptidase